jgi:hypothetical protein
MITTQAVVNKSLECEVGREKAKRNGKLIEPQAIVKMGHTLTNLLQNKRIAVFSQIKRACVLGMKK